MSLIVCLALAGCGGPAPSLSEIFAKEAGPYRWLEGRSALDLPYAPFDSSRIAPPLEKGRLEGQLYLAAKRGDEDVLFGRALFFQWRNGPGDLDRAESRLERMPQDARYWNEQALLLLARPDEFDALEAVDHALEIDPGFLPALFTRGVVLEKLSLQGLAIEAWETYAKADPDSLWGHEAIERRERLLAPEPPPVRLESERRKLYDELLALTGPTELADLASRPSTVELLARLRVSGDSMFDREFAVRRKFAPSEWKSSAIRRARLERLYESTMAGLTDVSALEELGRAPEPTVAFRAVRLLAFDAIQRADFARAKIQLAAVQRVCKELGCVEEGALATSDLGTVFAEETRFAEAEQAFQTALVRLPDGFDGRRAEVLVKQASLASKLGTRKDAQRNLINASAVLIRLQDPGALAVSLSNLASTSRVGFSTAALACRVEAMRLAGLAGRRTSELIAKGGVALKLAESGRLDAAKSLSEDALVEAESIGLSGTLVRVLGAAGRVDLLTGEPQIALEAGLRVERLAAQLSLPLLQKDGLELSGQASAVMGDPTSAIHFLASAIDIGRTLSNRATSKIRRLLMETEDAGIRVFLARLEAEEGRPDAAWELLGQGQLRSLEEDECVFAAASKGRTLSIWSATSQGTRYQEVELPVEIDQSSLTSALPTDGYGRGIPIRSATELQGRIGTPWEPGRCPARTRRLTVIENPFTLVGVVNRSARLARPDVAVVIARSVAALWPSRVVMGHGLAIHSPRPVISDRAIAPFPAAPKEARLIEEALPGSEELSEYAATPSNLVDRAGSFDLLHFSVHGESRKRKGSASYLLLAGPDGHLEVGNVLKLPLQGRNPVVVLSSCKGGGKTGDAEHDGAGLPWAFLEAGASAVIAYQGDLDDGVALDFARFFYNGIGRGKDVSAAFELALAALRVRWPPDVAASFGIYT
ncbi:CHAT domain-containing protein [Vulgatibacter incomptus]|uniref:CHAT domain-containing protein n=1 Tax=Vulgatibacter incomptus TaxID=1391653 RepID=UPI00147022A5|nr:CHAT domain-containing protein [Vulgatibacter incomptus]